MQTRVTRMAGRFERLEVITRIDVDRGPSVQDALIPQSQRCTLMQLNDHTCRWPVGDPSDPKFFFCGGATEPGQVYCSVHFSRASHSVPMVPIKLAPTGL